MFTQLCCSFIHLRKQDYLYLSTLYDFRVHGPLVNIVILHYYTDRFTPLIHTKSHVLQAVGSVA